MPTNDKPNPPGALDLRIDELETLLADQQNGNVPAPDANIPVLDEEVVPSAAPPEPEPGQAEEDKLTPRQLVELGHRLQQRVDAELADLAEILRSVVKRCILEELRKELPAVSGRSKSSPPAPGAHKPDTP